MNPAQNILIPAPILIPLGTAFILPFIGRVSRRLRGITCLAALLITLAILLRLGQSVFSGQILVYWMSDWTPRAGLAIGISLTIDAWGLLIALIAAGVGLAAVFFSLTFMEQQTGQGPYYILMMLLITGLIGFSLSGDLFNQFVWLEVFSVAAFALTAFHVEDREAIEAAFKYLITNSIAAFFIAIGLALLYMQTGALNLAQIAHTLKPTAAGVVAIGLLVGGYATKAALVPWHFWLPDAHAVSPAPVSALFSGALIKVGIYAVARNVLTLAPLTLGGIVQSGFLTIAVITMLVGGVQMMQQRSIKRILAFSSISQMGYILAGLALGTPLALAGAAMHALHHALVKSALFMGAGIVNRRSGAHTLDEAGDLVRRMPVTCLLMVIGALALSGLPFLTGFVSKTMLEESAHVAGADVVVVAMVVSSILTFAGLARLLWRVFAPRKQISVHLAVTEAPPLMLLPIAALLIMSFVLGLQPELPVRNVAEPAAAALHNREAYIDTVLNASAIYPNPAATITVESEHSEIPRPTDWHQWGTPLLVMVAGGLLAYISLKPARFSERFSGVLHIVHLMAFRLRQWHSGQMGDYALWNAFGTAVLLIGLLLAARFGLL